MRILIQRVTSASVSVEEQCVGEIGAGLVLLVAIGTGDNDELVYAMCGKISNLRIFEDDNGRMQLSARNLLDTGRAVGMLVVPQFTLYADVRKGRRPAYVNAAAPDLASPLVDACVAWFHAEGFEVGAGHFGAHMQVTLTNDGPVTIWIDSDEMQRPRKRSEAERHG